MANYNQNAPYEVRRAHFIERAKALWGDAFDYTDMQFTTGKEPCVITCRKHGPIRIGMAQNHILKDPRFRTGCPFCKEEHTGYRNYKQVPELIKERESDRKARIALNKQEQERKAIERKAKQEQKKADMALYVSSHGYDISQLNDQQIAQRYASIKGNEKLAPILAARRAERERKTQLQAEERKRKVAEDIHQRGLSYIARAKEIHGDKYDYTETTYEKKEYHGKLQWVLANIYCPTHGYFDARPDVHVTMKCGCNLCAGNYNFMPVEERKAHWVARCQKKYGDRFDYSQFNYVDNDTKGIIICREHNFAYEQDPWTHLRHAGGCPICTGSEGEVHIRKWLEDNNVTFTPQYKIPNENSDCKRQYLVADFHLPDYNLIVEMNGEQHYKYIAHFHDGREQWTFEDQQIRDQTLRTYCQDHHINLLEIKYDEINKIPQILKRTLKKYSC